MELRSLVGAALPVSQGGRNFCRALTKLEFEREDTCFTSSLRSGSLWQESFAEQVGGG